MELLHFQREGGKWSCNIYQIQTGRTPKIKMKKNKTIKYRICLLELGYSTYGGARTRVPERRNANS